VKSGLPPLIVVLQLECAPSTEMLERLTVPTRWTPEEGLSTVKVTGEDEPGYRFDEIEACSVTDEAEPTAADPVPEPFEVKYAKATPAAAIAIVQPSAANARLLVIQLISFSLA
jgi:hypothetical protein